MVAPFVRNDANHGCQPSFFLNARLLADPDPADPDPADPHLLN